MMLFADYEGFAVGWSLIFWGLSILTLFLGSLAFGLGVWRERTLAAKKNGGGEL